MPVKIRLSRKGKKHQAFYHIVATDSRMPRDGKFIEKLGTYDPKSNPVAIELDFEKTLHWLQTGAQPTDTMRSILSSKGVMLKKHLLEGVKKGALTNEQAEAKFEAWTKEKDSKVQATKSHGTKTKIDEKRKKLEAEVKVKEAKAAAILQKSSELAKEAAEAKAAQEAEQIAAKAAESPAAEAQA